MYVYCQGKPKGYSSKQEAAATWVPVTGPWYKAVRELAPYSGAVSGHHLCSTEVMPTRGKTHANQVGAIKRERSSFGSD